VANYGLPYKGSKNFIVKEIIDLLPSANRFVDLFGGGGAMSHGALLSKKYKSVMYNDYNPLICNLFKDVVNGKYNKEIFKPEFITREKFEELKDKDGYIKYIWSFGNNGKGYLFRKDIEEFKHQAHNFIVFQDKKGLEYLEKHFKDSYYWHIKEIQNEGDYLQRRLWYAKLILKIEAIRVTKLYSDIIYNMYKGLSYEEFKALKNIDMTRMIDKHIPSIPKRNYKISRKNRELIELKQLQRLQQLQQLERLQQLQQLKQLESSHNIEYHNMSYLDYMYQEGDLIYCDPPYENTSGYDKEFNHEEFYDWVYTSEFPIFFSSYGITDNRFKNIWVKEKRNRNAGGLTKKHLNENIYCNELGYELFEKSKYENTLF